MHDEQRRGTTVTSRRALIDVALGNEKASVVVLDGRLVNVLTREIFEAGVAIAGDRIAAVGDVEYTRGPDTKLVDAAGRYVTPGLVDGHLHCYHSYLGVNEFVEVMLTHGVTTTTDAFYGQGIVGGKDAVRFFKDAFDSRPLRLIFLVPTLSYLQNRELGLTPTPGIGVEDMHEMLDWDGCMGLEEPPFIPIVEKWDVFLDLFEATLERRKTITGHAAGIDWRQTQAYVAMGASTDHEAIAADEGLYKARAGLKLLMREGSGAFDVAELVKTYTEHGIDPRRLAFCADLASPEKLINEGGVDENLRVAVAHGVPPALAVQMATINVAEAFGVDRDLGVVAPGRYADLVLVEDLAEFQVQRVLVGGETMVDDGRFVGKLEQIDYPSAFFGTVALDRPLTVGELQLAAVSDSADVRVIGVTDGSLVTDERVATLQAVSGVLQPDIPNDVLPLAMADRFGKGTGVGVGFVQGFELKRGAIASTVNAVCENLVAVGAAVEDMVIAMNHLAEIGGGKVVIAEGEVLALVELPLLGLLSQDPLGTVSGNFERAFEAISELGCPLSNPFSTLEFCFACGEIGDIKLSDQGLLRVNPPEIVEVICA
jgi:adenine deaminase